MLKRIRATNREIPGAQFAIVASEYNSRYVDAMLRCARQVLRRSRAKQIEVIRVPGAFEIPVVVARLLKRETDDFDAIICLGVILQGETEHARLIAEAVSHALAQLQVTHAVPIIHEVLLFESEQQAKVRCLSRTHNRGAEAASTALAMAKVMRGLIPRQSLLEFLKTKR